MLRTKSGNNAYIPMLLAEVEGQEEMLVGPGSTLSYARWQYSSQLNRCVRPGLASLSLPK